MKRIFITAVAVMGLAMLPAVQASAAPTPSSPPGMFTGQGLIADGFGGYDLRQELCGTENGADADGPYLLWVFTSTKSTSATITGPWGDSFQMTRAGAGTFKYISAWYDPDDLVGAVSAVGSPASKNPQLVISHGCRPFTDRGAWCSPGFWRNAELGAWALTPYTREDAFNSTVNPVWFGGTFASNPTLNTVLTTPNTYSGPPLAGTSGYALNAFNGTGAMLTDSLDGYYFSQDVMVAGSDDACPIDHFGNVKE